MATTMITLLAYAAGSNAKSDAPLAALADGVVIDAPPGGLSVVAAASPSVAAVAFELDADPATRRVESKAPYALAGDDGGVVAASPSLCAGPHVVRVLAFEQVEAAKRFAENAPDAKPIAEASAWFVVVDAAVVAGSETGPRGWRLPVDAEEWTIFPIDREPGRVRHICVSSSAGSDKFSGTPGRPVKSLARAVALLEPGKQNVLWLRRGDAWRESFPTLTKTKAGKSPRLGGIDAGRPLIVQAWGPPGAPRPVVLTSKEFGNYQADVAWVVFHGIAFRAAGRVPGDAPFTPGRGTAYMLRFKGCRGVWMEDCELLGARSNCTFGGGGTFVVRRCVIADNYSPDPLDHSQGLYCDEDADGIWIEQNLFDHNGWLRPEDRPAGKAIGKATIYNHAIYLRADCGDDVTVRGNVFVEPASHGLQARSGGVVEDNVFMRCPTGMSFGLVNGDGPLHPGGVRGRVAGNVFIGTRDIEGDPRGTGILIDNTAANPKGGPTAIAGNLFTRALDANPRPAGPAILLKAGEGRYEDQSSGINDLSIEGNVFYRWADGVRTDAGLRAGKSGPGSINRVSVGKNPSVTGKTPARPDPERRAHADLVAMCRQQCRGGWRAEFTAAAVVKSLREAFGM